MSTTDEASPHERIVMGHWLQGDSMKRKFLNENVEVVATDLRALIHWANYGVSKARGGSYEDEIKYVIESYAEYLGMQIRLEDFMAAPEFKKQKKCGKKVKIKAAKGGKDEHH